MASLKQAMRQHIGDLLIPGLDTDLNTLVDDIVILSYQGLMGEIFAKEWLISNGWFVANASVEWDYKGVDMSISRPDREYPIYVQVKPKSVRSRQSKIVDKMYKHLDWEHNEIGIFYFTWINVPEGRKCVYDKFVVDPNNTFLLK